MLIFDGSDIVVRQRLEPESDLLVVCFAARDSALKHLNAPAEKITGPSESYFAKKGIPAILFTSRWNHWWQTPEMDRVIEMLEGQNLFDRYRQIVTYGMSMGGYGALMYSRKLHATRVIALAPQYSLDPKLVPGERRWAADRKRYKRYFDDMDAGLISEGQVAILYDPLFRVDRMHVRLIERHRPVTALVTPFAAHRVGRLLEDMTILSSAIESGLRNGIDQKALRRQVRAHRRQSPLYLSNLARKLADRKRVPVALQIAGQGIALLERQVVRHPERLRNSDHVTNITNQVTFLARLQIANRLASEAIPLLTAWLERLPTQRQTLNLLLAEAYLESDNLAQVRAILRAIASESPGQNTTTSVVALAGRLGSVEDALLLDRHMAAAITRDEGNAIQFGELLLRLGRPVEAAVYFRNAPDGTQVEARVLGLARAGHPDEARTLLARLLPGLKNSPSRLHIDNQILELAPARPPSQAPDVHALVKLLDSLSGERDPETLRKVDAETGAQLIANERLAIRFAALLRTAGMAERALVYLTEAPVIPGIQRERLGVRRLCDILLCGDPDTATRLLPRLLPGDALAAARQTIETRIQRHRVSGTSAADPEAMTRQPAVS